jgi:hypothetical protein
MSQEPSRAEKEILKGRRREEVGDREYNSIAWKSGRN